ncbi:MAG: T9SS type A sorting domain-containing protein [Dysgonamonadaceae bacterium]|jgi:hypothetical protein|nr:T9SS type A sorting domain-containing protein [Dysgonamonadaceae bacterium]
MKLSYFLRSLALVALMALVMNVKAADIRVANGATDTELAAALEQATTGDVILIDGWVTINAMVHVTKNVTIKAGVASAGFDGGGNTRLFEIHPDPVDGAKLVFENLDFTGGDGWKSDPTDGGVARIYGGVTEFVSCYFYENQARRAGAFMITENGTTVTFRKCEAFDNVAVTNGTETGESRGGYIFTDGETHIIHEYCQIYNNQSIGGRGGALCLFGGGTRRFYYSVLSSNKAGNWSEDGSEKLDQNGNPASSGEYEGGLLFTTGGATTFESCGIVDNKSWSHGGILMGWGGANITFINSTIAKNQSMHDRSPIWTWETTTTFVNSLFVDNLGQNAGNGAGFDGNANAAVRLNIFNSVFARNVAGSDGAVDIRMIPNYATQLTVKNSLIGLIQGSTDGLVSVDNPNIPTKSNIAMYKLVDTEQASLDYALLENSGVNFDQGIRYSASFGMPYYLLTAGSTVTKLGDPALLADYDLNTDLFGQTHTPAADGSISAAPTLASTEADYDDGALGIVIPNLVQKENFRIIGTVSNGILGVDFGNIKGLVKADLISLAGQVVENVFNTTVVGKGYYNVNVRPGIYLLRAVNNGNTYVQKVIVK